MPRNCFYFSLKHYMKSKEISTVIFFPITVTWEYFQNQVEGMKQKQLAALPLVLVEVVIFWWIFTSLISTMRVLRMRRNMVNIFSSSVGCFANTKLEPVVQKNAAEIYSAILSFYCQISWLLAFI